MSDKWDYLIIHMPFGEKDNVDYEVSADLKYNGERGWELVSVVKYTQKSVKLILKKKK